MLLFTKLLLKVWLVISRNHNVGFFSFSHMNLELDTELSLNYPLLFGSFKDRCVYASYRVEWLIGAVDLNHYAQIWLFWFWFLKFLKMPPCGSRAKEAHFTQFSSFMDLVSTWKFLCFQNKSVARIFIGS